ncbi:shikimate dehydrogenase [Terriglobus roseus]|uniref:Multifunctional fusion protein n=1 Tax=Terriglobus roseus TaxID=392734 RepID=A0A1G7GH45_9BACT|nr:shikimate dehydrogenase [Terriglobus roseus]SDE87339.1 3-dehydroquinate dehydratase [Terriglobus roseus]
MPAHVITPESLHQRAGRICVAVSSPEMFSLAEQTLPDCRFLEFRLDSVPDPAAQLPQLRKFLAEHPEVTAVATCRRQPYGGGFQGTAQQQIDILAEAAAAGCQLVDIETETAEELGIAALDTLRANGAAVILSWHDFQGTPALAPELDRMAPFAPDFRKIVPTATTITEALQLIDLLETHGTDGRLIAMSMGFRGTLTRVLGPRFGSLFTFASPEGNAGTAPGQVSISTLQELYRAESITPETAIYAVAGLPITGSLSPCMHNTAFRTAKRNAVYIPLETDIPAELLAVVDRLNIRGLSVTMPLKETILPHLAISDTAVQQMQTSNTLVKTTEGFAGYNTDVPGIVGPLQRVLPLEGAKILILGAGGAARAAVFGLRDAGAHVYLLNRTHARAEALATEAGVHAIRREDLAAHTFDAIINSTPYGMKNQAMEAPIAADEMRGKVFFDLVYNPIETPLLQLAQHNGLYVIPGVEMFVEQGVRQFTLWTGEPAPREAMQWAVVEALS